MPPFAAMNHVDGAETVTGGEHTVEGTGRAAPLDVAEDDRARLETSPLFDFAGQDVADSSQAEVAELVLADILYDGRTFVHLNVTGELRPFRSNDNAEVTATGVTLLDELGDLVDVEGHFGDQNVPQR